MEDIQKFEIVYQVHTAYELYCINQAIQLHSVVDTRLSNFLDEFSYHISVYIRRAPFQIDSTSSIGVIITVYATATDYLKIRDWISKEYKKIKNNSK